MDAPTVNDELKKEFFEIVAASAPVVSDPALMMLVALRLQVGLDALRAAGLTRRMNGRPDEP